MLKRMFVNLFLVFAILLSLVSTASAAPLAQGELIYTVKLGDNLWTLAEKYLGNGPAYWAIVGATNAEYAADASFAYIENPSLIHPGWKLRIPSADEAAKYTTLAKTGLSLVIGTNAEYPPFEMVDDAGNIIGFDPDLMVAIADAGGFTFKWVNTRWDGIFLALASGEFDAVISAATITAERAQTVDFSDPYFEAGQAIVVRADETAIKTDVDLAGKKVGVQLGTTGDIWLTDETEAEVVRYDENTLAVHALAAGDVDAAVMDNPTAAEIVRANPELNLKLLPGVYTEENYGIAVIKDRPEVLEAINKGLAAVKASGEYDRIWNKWFGVVAVGEPLVIGTTDKVTDLDPAEAYDFHTWEIFYNVAGGLVTYIPGTTQLKPDLAESYTVSDDGMEWTFKLHPGMKFPDGTPLDAEAVKWSVDRVVRLEGDPNWLVSAFLDEAIVVDDLTITFKLQSPVGFFPYVLVDPPWSPISPNCYPEDGFDSDSTCSGLGPYKIKRWERDVELELEANADYPGDPPKWPSIIVRYFADATTMRLALENGEIDVAWKTLLPSDYMDLEENPDVTVIEAPGAYIRYICFNSSMAPFEDIRLKQAVSLAIDRDEISDRVYLATHQPLYSMVPMGMEGHIDAFAERDLEKAKALLTEAGYSEASPLEVDLWWTPTHYGDTEADVATVIKTQLEETGMIKITLQNTEWATYTDYMGAGTLPFFLLGWYPDYLDPDNYTWSFSHSEASDDIGINYAADEMDALLEAARTETDQATRMDLYKQIQELWTTECPTVPFTQGALYAVTQKNVTGVTLSPSMLFPYFLLEK
jgi:peptide/nickel transport system substrate-binding protein